MPPTRQAVAAGWQGEGMQGWENIENREARHLKPQNSIQIVKENLLCVAWKDLHKMEFNLIVFYVRVILLYIDYFQCT